MRWITTASEISKDGWDECTCCGKKLTGAVRMLEYDRSTGTYHDFRDVPESSSQGWFPFGLSCARKKVKEAKELRLALSSHQGKEQ